MPLYEITNFTPSAVVNCDVNILCVLLSILTFIYRQIIILLKYNICCINLCFVLFLNTLKTIIGTYFLLIVSLYQYSGWEQV